MLRFDEVRSGDSSVFMYFVVVHVAIGGDPIAVESDLDASSVERDVTVSDASSCSNSHLRLSDIDYKRKKMI